MSKELFAIADRFEPRIRRALYAAFHAMRKRVPVGLIQRKFEGGGIEGVMSLLNKIEDDLKSTVRDELRNAITESGRVTIGLMPTAAVLNPDFMFDVMNPATADFVRQYEFNLIRLISENTREAVRMGLTRDVISGRNPLDTARTFRSSLGLTPKQSTAVTNYRKALEELDRRALTMMLRDKRFDRTVLRAIDDNRRLSTAQINKMVGRYQERFVKYRSQVIARTEALRAASIGQQVAIKQILSDGAVDGDKVRRFWVPARDNRTRNAHRVIPEMNPEGVPLDGVYKTPLGPLAFPRDPSGVAENTIQCRCAERFKLME
jgi:hypothetical protein